MDATSPVPGPAGPDPSTLRLRAGVRIEVLDDEVLALDPIEGVVHRLEGPAARIVADLLHGRSPALTGVDDHAILAALREVRIVEDVDPA